MSNIRLHKNILNLWSTQEGINFVINIKEYIFKIFQKMY